MLESKKSTKIQVFPTVGQQIDWDQNPKKIGRQPEGLLFQGLATKCEPNVNQNRDSSILQGSRPAA